MRSLFSKIFLSFVLIILLSGFFTLLISRWAPVGPFGGLKKQLMNQRADDLAHLLSTVGLAAEKILAQAGEDELITYLLEAGEQEHDCFFLLREDYTTFSGRKLPESAVDLAVASRNRNDMQSKLTDSKIIIALPLEQNRQVRTIVGTANGMLRSSAFIRNQRKTVGLVPIVLMTLLAAPACYIVVRSLTTPIRNLRQATQRMSQGDYSARVDLFGSRSDELVDLSYDFNMMAQKIQSLLESRKRLLRDISHELRSPLTRLNVALEMLRQQPGNTESHLARIEKESTRLNELITQLLTLARIEAQFEHVSRQPVSLQNLLGNIVYNAQFEAVGEDNKKEIKIEEFDDITVLGSSEMLSRALENVIRNGLYYTPPGFSVDIRVLEYENQVSITVQDHGPGVPHEQLTQIFKPFFRVNEARDRKSGGTGIGLTIAKQAILMHGGSIEAKNGEEDGLIIEITLPLS